MRRLAGALLALALGAWAALPRAVEAAVAQNPGDPSPVPGSQRVLPVAHPGSAARVTPRPLPTAASTVELTPGNETIIADSLGEIWVDPLGQAGLNEALAALARGEFMPASGSTMHRLGTAGQLWLHLRLRRAPGAPAGWMLGFPTPVLDQVTLYQRDEEGRWREQTAGDQIAVDDWPEPGRYVRFRLDLPPGEARDLMVRVRHATPINLSVRLSSLSVHEQAIQVEYLGLGMAFGALVLLIAACLLQSWVYRDSAYAWYAVYASLLTLAIAAYTGVAGHLLWSCCGAWADNAQATLALLAAGAALLFVRHLCGTVGPGRWLDRLVLGTGWSGAVAAAVFLTMPKTGGLVLLLAYLGIVGALLFVVPTLAWRRGEPAAVWVLAALAPVAVAVLLALARVYGRLPLDFASQYAVVLAATAQVPLLLVALAIRARERHGTRARELALSSQDALTGLLAPHLFRDRLAQVVTRYRRHREDAAVMFIDLVNHPRIKASHGTAVAEQSLLRSVIKLRRLLRDVDTAARIGEARFAVILDGVASRGPVTDRAARLIAAGLMPLKGLKPEVTLQFHVAAVLLRERLLEPDALMQALSDRLASMSPRTRRPIRFIEPEDTVQMPLDSMRDDDETRPPHPQEIAAAGMAPIEDPMAPPRR